MWFKNIKVLRAGPLAMTGAALNAKLSERPLTPCGGLDRQRVGWVPAHGDQFAYEQAGQFLIAMGIEDKLLPAAVVKQAAEKKIAEITEAEGYKPGTKRRREIREQIEDDLLPRAFTKRKTVFAWIDTANGWLVINASSAGMADTMLHLIVETLPDLPIRFLTTNLSPSAGMTGWLAGGEAPDGFTIDRDGELRLPGEDNATVRYVHHALDGQDIGEHIAAGKRATRLGLTWADRVSFVLTDKLEVKRLQFLDILTEQAEQADDAEAMFQIEFALMTGELAGLLAGIIPALGGEVEQ